MSNKVEMRMVAEGGAWKISHFKIIWKIIIFRAASKILNWGANLGGVGQFFWHRDHCFKKVYLLPL